MLLITEQIFHFSKYFNSEFALNCKTEIFHETIKSDKVLNQEEFINNCKTHIMHMTINHYPTHSAKRFKRVVY